MKRIIINISIINGKKNYTYIFTSFETFLLKKLKKNLFNNYKFTNKLYLLPINEIDLINK